MTTLSLIVGGFAPHIAGLVDQQPVRAGAVASVTGLPAGASVLWGGDLPETLGGTSLTLPVERMPDGPARITATATAGPSSTDYLYVTVDSTPPTGGAGPDQTVPVGRRAVFVTQAADANGLAAVRFRFKAGGSRRRAAGEPARPAVPARLHEARHLRGHGDDHRSRGQRDDRPRDRARRQEPGLGRSAGAGPPAPRGAPASS